MAQGRTLVNFQMYNGNFLFALGESPIILMYESFTACPLGYVYTFNRDEQQRDRSCQRCSQDHFTINFLDSQCLACSIVLYQAETKVGQNAITKQCNENQ